MCLKQYSYRICHEYANASEEILETTVLSHLQTYNSETFPYGNLNVPHEQFVYYIEQLETFALLFQVGTHFKNHLAL